MSMLTKEYLRYVQVVPSDETPSHRADAFKPWIESEQDEEELTARLAAHQFVRFRGGLDVGESIDLTVWVYDSRQTTKSNGDPSYINQFRIRVTNDGPFDCQD